MCMRLCLSISDCKYRHEHLGTCLSPWVPSPEQSLPEASRPDSVPKFQAMYCKLIVDALCVDLFELLDG